MKQFILFLTAGLVVFSCGNDQQKTTEPTGEKSSDSVAVESAVYDYQNRFSASEMDTLLTNLASYIYAKPVDAQWNTKFEPRFRPFFIEKRTNFEVVYMHQHADSSFYFYLLRDAQFKNGYVKRGVLGKFNMDLTTLELSNFEEIVNTPVDSDPNLKGIGQILMDELIATGNVDKFLSDKTKVEYPDGRVFYSKEKFEWRYLE